jgi:hypothetical protein
MDEEGGAEEGWSSGPTECSGLITAKKEEEMGEGKQKGRNREFFMNYFQAS